MRIENDGGRQRGHGGPGAGPVADHDGPPGACVLPAPRGRAAPSFQPRRQPFGPARRRDEHQHAAGAGPHAGVPHHGQHEFDRIGQRRLAHDGEARLGQVEIVRPRRVGGVAPRPVLTAPAVPAARARWCPATRCGGRTRPVRPNARRPTPPGPRGRAAVPSPTTTSAAGRRRLRASPPPRRPPTPAPSARGRERARACRPARRRSTPPARRSRTSWPRRPPRCARAPRASRRRSHRAAS